MNLAFSLSSRKSERVSEGSSFCQPRAPRKAKAGAFAYVPRRQRLEPSLTLGSSRLAHQAASQIRVRNARTGQRLEPSLTTQAAKLPGADAVRDNSGRNRLPLAQG